MSIELLGSTELISRFRSLDFLYILLCAPLVPHLCPSCVHPASLLYFPLASLLCLTCAPPVRPPYIPCKNPNFFFFRNKPGEREGRRGEIVKPTDLQPYDQDRATSEWNFVNSKEVISFVKKFQSATPSSVKKIEPRILKELLCVDESIPLVGTGRIMLIHTSVLSGEGCGWWFS